jgi:hypothetical protein
LTELHQLHYLPSLKIPFGNDGRCSICQNVSHYKPGKRRKIGRTANLIIGLSGFELGKVEIIRKNI